MALLIICCFLYKLFAEALLSPVLFIPMGWLDICEPFCFKR